MTGRRTIDRIVAALCAGRPARAVAARLHVAAAMLAVLYAAACVFLVLEPVA